VKYRYDGLHRRIAKLTPNYDDGDWASWDRTDYHYTAGWQVIEERISSAQSTEDAVATDVKYQYVWDLRYIDSPICRDTDANDVPRDTIPLLSGGSPPRLCGFTPWPAWVFSSRRVGRRFGRGRCRRGS
jgi:hypothetical protein